MKSRIMRHITKATLCTAVLLVTVWFAQPANAQTGIQGRFTLPYEAHWGQAVLPAGDYQLTFVADSLSTTMLIIRDANSLQLVAFEPVNIREDSKEGTSALLIGKKGTQRIVYSLRIAELGEAFVYERPPAVEARQTQVVPVVVAKK